MFLTGLWWGRGCIPMSRKSKCDVRFWGLDVRKFFGLTVQRGIPGVVEIVWYYMEFLVSSPAKYGKYGLYIHSVIYGITYRQNRTSRAPPHPGK
jgi:hypothetical protein